jgi:UDP-N-acetyl-D-mannosaminuronic acid dehydrogenase
MVIIITKEICVIGLGYIGLPTASALATSGFKVIGFDTNRKILEDLESGRTNIEEPGLRIMVKAAVSSGNLIARQEIVEADVFIICVPTPIKEDKKIDLSFVVEAAELIVPKLRSNNLVILESTVSPGTTKNILKPIFEKSGLEVGKDLFLAHCPERVLPGNLLNELVANERIIGGVDEESAKLAAEIYKSFVDGTLHITNTTTAELVKSMENTYRAVNIALSNEMAKIADKIDVDIIQAIKFANRHPRVNFLLPGPGVGGHCIPIDPWFIVESAPEISKLIPISMKINDSMPLYIVELIKNAFNEVNKDLRNSKISILGVAYKPNVDDARESPAIPIIKNLLQFETKVFIYDPYVKKFEFELNNTFDEVIQDSDAIVIITDHKEFHELNLSEIQQKMNQNPILIDTKNMIQNHEGFTYRGVGR